MFLKAKYNWLLSLLIMFYFSSLAQNYADKNYYLIDSLELNKINEADKKLIESSLDKFHKAAHDTIKVNSIYKIIEESWDETLWPKYNAWLHNFMQPKMDSINNDEGVLPSEIKYNYLKHFAGTLSNEAIIFSRKGKLVMALDMFYESLKIREDINDKRGQAECYNNMADIYRDQEDHKKELELFMESLRLLEEINDRPTQGYVLNNIGSAYQSIKNFNKAIEYYIKSLKVSREVGNKTWEAICLNNIGEVQLTLNKKEKAYNNFIEALTIEKEIGFEIGEASSSINLAKIFIDNNNNTHKAIELGKKSLLIAKSKGYPKYISRSAKVLHEIYRKEGDWKLAYDMYTLQMQMQDSMRNKGVEKALIKQQYNYDIEKKEKEIELLSSKNTIQSLRLEKNRNITFFAWLALLLLAILLYFAYRAYQKKLALSKVLEKKNEEKRTMLKEIHHRVKNNLQVVNSLLKFQSREIEDQNVLAMFKEAQSRVLSMALLHEKMYNTKDIKHIDVQEHFKLLVEDLVKTYAVKKKINVDVSINNVNIGLGTLVPLGLIINEIISNSLKHAFKNINNGEIKVHIQPLYNNSTFEMIIGDNGTGLNDNEKSTGLGTKLIKIFTKQLNATIKRIDEPGTNFKFIFEKID